MAGPYIPVDLSAPLGRVKAFHRSQSGFLFQRDLSLYAPGVPIIPGTLRQNFGIYPSFYYAGGVGNSTYTNNDHGIISGNANVIQIAGWHIQALWRTIDKGAAGAIQANYDWSVFDNYRDGCAAAGKQLRICISEAFINNGSSVATGAKVVPDWISSQLGGVQNTTINYAPSGGVFRGVASKRYSATLVTYWIAFLKAICTRYENDPNVESIEIYEESAFGMDTSGTSVTLATPGADYSEGGMLTQMLRIISCFRDPAQFNSKKLNWHMGMNYLFTRSDTQPIYDQVYTALQAAQAGYHCPDTWIASWTCPNTPLTNINYPQQNETASNNPSFQRNLAADSYYRGWWGGTDRRGKILCSPRCEVTDLGGYITANMNPVPTPQDLFHTRMTYDKVNYFSCDVITPFSGYNPGNQPFPGAGPAQQWSTGFLPFIKTLTLPTTYNVSPY